MAKRNSIRFLTFLMILSLLGIVFTQYYLLQEAFHTNEQIFSGNAAMAIYETAKKIRDKEKDYYDEKLGSMLESLEKSSKKIVREEVKKIIDEKNSQYAYLERYIVEYIYIPMKELDQNLKDVLSTRKIERSEENIKESWKNLFFNSSNEHLIHKKRTFDKETYAKIMASRVPIEKRINSIIIQEILNRELSEKEIYNTPYEFAVFDSSDNSSTLVRSRHFDVAFKASSFREDLFSSRSGKTTYFLLVYFPEKNKVVVKMIYNFIIFSIGIVLIILAVYAASLFYLGRQKRISEMKNDFINNITHEFKTPIATINIASGILRNPMINQDPSKVNYYSEIIAKENTRLNTQVDMVLTIAKLENNNLNLSFELVNVDTIVAQAVDRIRLIVENREGTIKESYEAKDAQFRVDPIHFENVILNILQNAEKYSYDNPDMRISTFVKEKFVFIQIEDKGIGMSKEILKKIFDPFFRAEGSDTHNVKGYGLGLSYCQKIINLHGGSIFIESKNRKGTKCIIKMGLK